MKAHERRTIDNLVPRPGDAGFFAREYRLAAKEWLAGANPPPDDDIEEETP